jgi:ABC-type transport system involved in multi-copper enzyme maturation permease subunit
VTGLLRAELRRLSSRRLVRVLAVLAVLAILFVEGRAFLVSDRNVAAAQRQATARAAEFQANARKYQAQADKDCNEAKTRGDMPQEIPCPGIGQVPDAAAFYRDPRLHVRRVLKDGAGGVTVAVAVLAFVVGASFVGAEWNAGTMQALLFWEPRRGRVLLAKAVALVAGMLTLATVLQAIVYGLTMLTGATRGTTEGVTTGLQLATLLTVLRGFVVVSFTALLGYGIAGLARVTGAALGVAFGWFVILENLIRAKLPGWERFLVTNDIAAVLVKKQSVAPADGHRFDQFGVERAYRLTATRGTVTLAVYLVLVVGAFVVTFRRRDVT